MWSSLPAVCSHFSCGRPTSASVSDHVAPAVLLAGPDEAEFHKAEYVQTALHEDEHGVGLVLDPEALVVEALLPGILPHRHLGSIRLAPLTVWFLWQEAQPANAEWCRQATF